MAETVQAEDIDHSAEGAAYIGKVHGMNIIHRLSNLPTFHFSDFGGGNLKFHS